MLNFNSVLYKGSTHTICEDYALVNQDKKLAVLSDGCSSGRRTDIGARLTCLAFEETPMFSVFLKKLNFMLEVLPIVPNDMLATCLSLHTVEEEGLEELKFRAIGDGMLLLINNNGSYSTVELDYPSGYPLYPLYLNDETLMELMLKTSKTLVVTTTHYDELGNHDSIVENLPSQSHYYKGILLDDLKCAIIMSDGIKSFVDNKGNSLSSDYVIDKIRGFKNFNGNFIQRRVNKVIKELESEGYHHYDDLSIAGVYHNAGPST